MSFIVHVVNDDQDPVEGARVVLSFKGLAIIGGGMTDPEYTDSDGHVYFDGHDRDEVEIFVDGQSYRWYIYEEGESVTITV